MSQLIMSQACFYCTGQDTLENVEKESNAADLEENVETKLHHHLQAKTPAQEYFSVLPEQSALSQSSLHLLNLFSSGSALTRKVEL